MSVLALAMAEGSHVGEVPCRLLSVSRSTGSLRPKARTSSTERKVRLSSYLMMTSLLLRYDLWLGRITAKRHARRQAEEALAQSGQY